MGKVNTSGIRRFAIKLLFIALLLGPMLVIAQNQPLTPARQIVDAINTYASNAAIEKLYLQTDKTNYSAGDTLWFKGYLFNAADLSASRKSGLLYAEITDENNKVVKRAMLSVIAGQVWGNIPLYENAYPAGLYTLRAYTNWMRNYNEAYVFKKQFSITSINTGEGWLINSRLDMAEKEGKPNVKMTLDFTDLKQTAIAARDVEVTLTEGRKRWFRNKMMIGVDGALDFNFNLPEKADPQKLTIKITEQKKDNTGATYLVPVLLKRPEHTDLQFMPEGGALVAGLKSKVAFKAIAEDGNGTDVNGVVYNSKQQQVAIFKSAHRGMGYFYLQPQAGETYTAVIKNDATISKTYPLPLVKPSGMVLRVADVMGTDSVAVNITASADMTDTPGIYYLVAQSRGMANYAAAFKPDVHGKWISISKNIFPTGITRISILNQRMQPLNERIIFVDHHDRLCVNINSNKKTYGKRDSVGLDITVTDQAGMPVQGIFSMAVTDDSQVKVDSMKNSTLVNTLLLTADLKGNVEDPGYYLKDIPTEETTRDLDNLLLTQGWVNYDWSKVFNLAQAPAFPAEQSFTIKGKVLNIFNKPVANSGVVLLSKKPALVLDTVTNASGVFEFKNIYPSDTAAYVIQARNKKGKSFNVGIEMDEFVPPVFAAMSGRLIPNYLNMDSLSRKAVNTRMANKLEENKMMGIHQLKEVVITDKKIIKDSKNLNGPGESDFAMNEADIEKAGKTTLGDLLRANIKGFSDRGGRYYVVNSEAVILIIDGVAIHKLMTEGMRSYKDLYDESLNYFTAEDIKGIEFMQAGRYGMAYFAEYMHPLQKPFDFCYVEVTTRAGKGPYYTHTPGVYVYKPLPFALPAEFYSPKYTVKTRAVLPDIRSTIYWKPNIITGKDGKAQVSFYTADKPGTYTLMLEGSDMQGSIESMRTRVVVK
ncbi:hypothetical protein HQ865_14595 [Mucilaginibacter mali]|uniref:MG2 domain-containing protein n=1 Tax=Mucilaginibacter mali TaxID=2740462 RepID=A0A7D4QAM8_9SPHI|nr:hypothetical protein [Mucilaginibacter mali]QKJ30925.1 hypothetical protein HQ865_14595 [Mucilaginibacter mali]